MAEFSTYMENAIVNLMRNTAFTQIPAYVALFTSTATGVELEAGTLTNEVSGGAYARQLAGLSAPSDGVTANAADITFPTATANWGTVAFVALMDALTAGNVLMYSALDVNKVVNSGDIFKINLGDLDITVT